MTVSNEFRTQLTSLMTTIRETEPHFVRCIKPNEENVADKYDRPHVVEQLRYGGVLQVVQISRAGYPVRLAPEDAWLDYCCLLPLDKKKAYENSATDTHDKVKKMLSFLAPEEKGTFQFIFRGVGEDSSRDIFPML